MASCASIQKLTHKSDEATAMYGIHDVEFKSEDEAKKDSLFKMPNLFQRDHPRIVTVREEDLKRLRTGNELARSYERQSRYQIRSAPIDFPEPSYSDSESSMSGSLLPSR